MSDKWKWILYVWHGWRAAVWRAEMCLYPREHHGNIISTPVRYDRAEAMHEYHHYAAKGLHRDLFPPEPPLDMVEVYSKIKRGQF
jgi:hypothetical protein